MTKCIKCIKHSKYTHIYIFKTLSLDITKYEFEYVHQKKRHDQI
jgi:hypothetical protein